MKVGFFSPLPPANTGVADYSAALLRAMRRASHGDVRAGSAGDVNIYHVGNNQIHRAIYERAIIEPGVVVLHDAVLNHFFLGSLDRERYVGEFVFNYGEWSRDFGARLWANRARSAAGASYFEYPMLRRIAERSRAVIVHNPAAAARVRRHAPGARVVEIPHLFEAPALPSIIDTLRFRKELGLKPRTLVVGVFGHLRESKRLPVILRAMRAAWDGSSPAVLLVAGDFASRDLERAVSPQLRDPRILRVGHLPEADFWRFIALTDVCINLRYPAAGESSGIAVRMMGAGKAVVFTNGEEVARIPESACLRVDAGIGEEQMLADIVRWLSRERETAEEIGKRARHWIGEECDAGKVAAQYWDVVRAVARQ
jgi:glycosyltransferase involved in cell wall biosynthesis